MYRSEGENWENGVCVIWNGILWGGRRFTLYFHWSDSQTEWFDLQLDQELAGTWLVVCQVVWHVKNIFNEYVDDVLGMLLNKLFDTSQSIGLRLIWAAGISQLSRWSRQTIVAYIDYLSGVDIVCVRTHCIIAQQTLARMVIEYEGRGDACYAITSLVRHRSKYAQSNAS